MSGRRLRHKARGACPMAGAGVECHAYGREAACGLCTLVDLDHHTTRQSLGLEPLPGIWDRAEDDHNALLARRLDGRPCADPGGR